MDEGEDEEEDGLVAETVHTDDEFGLVDDD